MPRPHSLPLTGLLLILLGPHLALAAPPTAPASETKTPPPIFPCALSPGDTILIVAPAKYLDRPRIQLAKLRLEKLGFQVSFPKNLFRKHGYLAGTDAERADEINAAFADPDVDAIFPGTGGYGTTRIVDDLDYDLIRRNPKILIGFSDITGLHVAINGQTGLVTFHSPVPQYGLGNPDGFAPWPAHWFWRAILAKNYTPKFSRVAGDVLSGPGADSNPGYTIPTIPTQHYRADHARLYHDVPAAKTLVPGTARGRLIGGNLSVLHAMMGSQYEIQTAGKILFLEDVGEAPYRIDRMLSTLKLAGKLDHVSGVLLGRFTRRKDEDPWDDDWSIAAVLEDYFAKLGVPVLKNFPAGHVPYNTTLPIGAEVELNATTGTLTLLENPVQLPKRDRQKE